MGKPSIETLTGKKHLSYSGLDTYQQCGEKYRLTRVLNVKETKAWWFIGGSAIHRATEWWDLGDGNPLPKIWADAWEEVTQDIEPGEKISAGGRVSNQWPNKEDHTWWNFHGPQMLEDYVRWRDESKWQIYSVNDTPFVEWEFLLTLDNPIQGDDVSESVQVKGFVDRVFVTPEGEAVVVDLKAGKNEPASAIQLGIYCAALRQRGGIDPALGGYYMTRKGTTPNLRGMGIYTDRMLGYILGTFEDSAREQKFLPVVSNLCGTCTVQEFCYAVGGNPPDGGPFKEAK